MDTIKFPPVPTADYSEQIAEARKFLESKGIYEVKSLYAAARNNRGHKSGMVSEKSNKILRWRKKRT